MTSTYTARGTVVPGGTGHLQSHGLDVNFDGSAGRGTLPGPADLLAAALSACLLKNVERFSHLLSFQYAAAAVDVELEREEPPPRITKARYQLRLVTTETPERVELLHRNIKRSGTVGNTLAAACDLDGTLTVVDRID
jgi:organic hydroperoxide reductase OsmC/OhrA